MGNAIFLLPIAAGLVLQFGYQRNVCVRTFVGIPTGNYRRTIGGAVAFLALSLCAGSAVCRTKNVSEKYYAHQFGVRKCQVKCAFRHQCKDFDSTFNVWSFLICGNGCCWRSLLVTAAPLLHLCGGDRTTHDTEHVCTSMLWHVLHIHHVPVCE